MKISTLEIRKFDFPIIHYTDNLLYGFSDYFQLCQGDKSQNELYFYLDYLIGDKIEVILPIIGSFDTYFINEKDIKSFSDLDFNEEKKLNSSNINNLNGPNGLLKIKCNNMPTMAKFMIPTSYDKLILHPGNKYNIMLHRFKELSINKDYINKNIPLKFNIFGLYYNESIELIL